MLGIKNTILYVLTIGFLLNGCAVNRGYIMNKEGEVVKSTLMNQNANGPLWHYDVETPKGENGLIVFIRRNYADSYIVEPEKLYVNGKFITDMKQNGFYPLHIKAGNYTFTLSEPDPKDVEYQDTQVISGELKAGQALYIEIGSKTESVSGMSVDASGYFKKNMFITEPKTGLEVYGYPSYYVFGVKCRLSATRKRDIIGLVRLKNNFNNKVKTNSSIDKKTILDTSGGVLKGVKSSMLNNNADLLNNGLAGAVAAIIPNMIKSSVTSKNNDNYLKYIGTDNNYDMNYILEEPNLEEL